MKITSQQVYNLRNKRPNNITEVGSDKSPSNFSNINFGSNLPARLTTVISDSASVIFAKAKKEVTGTNAEKLISNLNALFGEETFSKNLNKAGGKIIENKIIVPNRSFLKDDLLKTLLFPVDIFTSVAEKLSNKGVVQYKDDGFIQKLINNRHKAQARDWVLDTIEEFSQRNYGEDLNIEKYTSKFKDIITENGTKIKKGYATRDERTLNRVVTSCVSAMFSASDFYNISMLEKDNKDEAKKAGKHRLKQELSRMGFNASLTFIALGMFDRYTKKSIILNSLVIAGSALIAEISSRLMSGTPLKALTPEEAAKIAQLRKEKQAKKESIQIQNQAQENNKKVSFKANAKTQSEIFKDFTLNTKMNALDVQKQSIAQSSSIIEDAVQDEPKKKVKLGKILGLAFGGATLVFFLAKALKGDFKAIKRQKDFLETFGDESMKKSLCNENIKVAKENVKIFFKNIFKRDNKEPMQKFHKKVLDISMLDENAYAQAKKQASIIATDHKNATDSFSFWKNFQEMLITTKKSKRTDDIITELENLKNRPDAKGIEGVLNAYIDHAKKYAAENEFVTTKEKTFFISGVVKGFSKIFKTIYDILTIPAKALNAIGEFVTGADVNRKAFQKAHKQLNPNADKYKKELMDIHNKIEKASKVNFIESACGITSEQKMQDLIKTIGTCARNVETSQETGDLANISRTMVTAIGTYFFVNDYKNTVLIESEGKNVKGAKEEAKERIWHKAFNFVFNGTLMNVFNTTFAKIVNGSLAGAAIIASLTELTNESLIRKSLCQPALPQNSKQDIINYEQEQIDKGGFAGWWSRTFKKLTGKKTLTQKAGIDTKKMAQQKEMPTSKISSHQG